MRKLFSRNSFLAAFKSFWCGKKRSVVLIRFYFPFVKDQLDKARVEVVEMKRKAEEKKAMLPLLLEQGPQTRSYQPNTSLDKVNLFFLCFQLMLILFLQVLSEQEKQAEISKRAMAAMQQDPLMNELLQTMQKQVKDRRTVRANKRAQIQSGVNVFSDKGSGVVAVKDLTAAFVPKKK
jgi:hypothetical protein